MARKSATNAKGPAATTTQQDEEKKPFIAAVDSAITGNEDASDDEDEKQTPFDPSLLPNGTRDLSFIGLQAFCLGIAFSAGGLLTAYFISTNSTWWRLPTFILFLSLFHFLEYYTTARYNVPAVRASSFLLFNNGKAYTTAHTLAIIEITVSHFFPEYQAALVLPPWTIALGLLLVLVGQTVRSIAMAQAGTNFNHIVAHLKKDSHVLVTRGLYGWLRHPSYFGFFWWAVGTQILVGNKVCLVGYCVALWRFFYYRTRVEERNLVLFFGEQYEEYRKRTGTMIPFVP